MGQKNNLLRYTLTIVQFIAIRNEPKNCDLIVTVYIFVSRLLSLYVTDKAFFKHLTVCVNSGNIPFSVCSSQAARWPIKLLPV